jgi:excisionase family DNA binding protein
VTARARLLSALSPELLGALESLIEERLQEQTAASRFLSKSALAEHYGVSERTVRTWREKGLPGVRVGREVLYEVAAVDRWIEAHG